MRVGDELQNGTLIDLCTLPRRPFKPNTTQKERFGQNTVAVHFKVY